jgi:hypothetical protein
LRIPSGGAALPPVSYLLAAVVVTIVAVQMARLGLDEAWPLAISRLFLPFTPGSIPAPFEREPRQRRCARPRRVV